MLKPVLTVHSPQRGVLLIEVLVTIVVLAVGLLGLANLLNKMHLAEVEAYQRAQAVVLLSDMVERINANRANAAAYVTGANAPLGTGDNQPATCPTTPGVGRDQCEWSNALKGAAEKQAPAGGGAMVGAMTGGRGCVELLQAANPAAGVCSPAVYRVTVTWQGLNSTVAPSLLCANNLYGTGVGDTTRRAISSNLAVGMLGC